MIAALIWSALMAIGAVIFACAPDGYETPERGFQYGTPPEEAE